MRVAILTLVIAAAGTAWACMEASAPEKDRRSARQVAMAHRCDSLVKALVGNAYGATVLISMNDTIVLNAGYGSIDTTRVLVPTDTTLFHIASMSKSFTAIAIAQLEQNERLHRSDRLGQYLPGLPTDKRDITIEQCLTHR